MKWFTILIVAVFASGCGPRFLVINNLHFLEKGMSRESVAEMMPKDPDKSISISYQGKRFDTDGYALQTAQAQSRSTQYNATTGVSTTYNTTTDYTNTFICLYSSGRLRYWGLIQDFSKSDDAEIQALSEQVYNAYILPD